MSVCPHQLICKLMLALLFMITKSHDFLDLVAFWDQSQFEFANFHVCNAIAIIFQSEHMRIRSEGTFSSHAIHVQFSSL